MPGIVTPWFIVLGYNAFIVIAGTGYLLGVTQGKEYAEPEIGRASCRERVS
jgi:cytochrome c oxidase cbb3-type subunit 1